MRAKITDYIDLLLQWDCKGKSTLKFSPCSNCEFEILGDIWFDSDLNYQGPMHIAFQTTCYACSLSSFGDALTKFAAGNSELCQFIGSEDLTITIRLQQGQADASDRSITLAEIEYAPFRSFDCVRSECSLRLPLGTVDDAAGCAQAIAEVCLLLQMDTRPSWQLPPDAGSAAVNPIPGIR